MKGKKSLLDRIENIDLNLKYKEFNKDIEKEFILPVDNIEKIKSIIIKIVEENTNVKIKEIDNKSIVEAIAKLGLIDLRIEIQDKIEYPEKKGFDILYENNFIEKNEKKEFDFLEIIDGKVSENKNFVRIYLTSKVGRSFWYKNNKEQFLNYTKTKTFTPKKGEENQIFILKAICITNCDFIWFNRYFYV